MHYLLTFFFYLRLLIIPCSKITVEAIDMYVILNDIDEFNITCYQDNCKNPSTDSLSSRSCHCGIQCVQLGTCCADSYYADVPQPMMKPACRSVYNGGTYFIVDKCSSGSAWTNLCNEEWNMDSDIQKLVPVTSISTSITYKNYFCFRCHETNDEFLYWTLKMESNFVQQENFEDKAKNSDKHMSITYHRAMNTWMMISDDAVGYFPVNISLQIPREAYKLTHACEQDVISDCSYEWPYEEVRIKCHSYMSMKEVRRNNLNLMYKNVHCALCNFESLNDVYCKPIAFGAYGGKKPFSFTYFLDINRNDGGEVVGKIQNCPDGEIWDPYTKQCRELTCALPGYKVINNKCVKD